MAQFSDVGQLLGRSIDDPDVRAFLQNLDTSAQISEEEGKAYWSSEPVGLEVQADGDTRHVTMALAYGGGYDDFERFAGPLPASLSMDLTRDQLYALLGRPDKTGRQHDAWERDDHAIMIEYFSSGRVKTLALTTH